MRNAHGPALIVSAILIFSACAESSTSTPAEGSADRDAQAASLESSWPIFRGDPGLSGIAPGSLPDQFALLWAFECGGAITSSPVVSDGLVYFGSDDQHVYALDVKTGEKAWAFKTDDMIEAPPLVFGDAVYIGSSDFFFYALDKKKGTLLWKYETDDKILGGANVIPAKGESPDRIVVGSYDSYLYCFDAKSGEKLWSYQTDNFVNATPAVTEDHIIFGGCDAILHVVSAQTGKADSKIELGADCHVAGSVGIVNRRVYFGHYGNEFLCMDLEKGEPVWRYPSRSAAFFAAPAITKDRIIFGGRDKHVHCLNTETGEFIWKFKTRRKVDASAVVCGDKVVFGSGDGRLYVLEEETGKEVWSYELGRSIFSSPAVVEGRILTGCNDGWLYVFGDPKALPEGQEAVRHYREEEKDEEGDR